MAKPNNVAPTMPSSTICVAFSELFGMNTIANAAIQPSAKHSKPAFLRSQAAGPAHLISVAPGARPHSVVAAVGMVGIHRSSFRSCMRRFCKRHS